MQGFETGPYSWKHPRHSCMIIDMVSYSKSPVLARWIFAIQGGTGFDKHDTCLFAGMITICFALRLPACTNLVYNRIRVYICTHVHALVGCII